jgi:hypothetical protein
MAAGANLKEWMEGNLSLMTIMGPPILLENVTVVHRMITIIMALPPLTVNVILVQHMGKHEVLREDMRTWKVMDLSDLIKSPGQAGLEVTMAETVVD